MTQTTKTQVVFPKHILRELDQVVVDRQRSQFVVAATRKELERIKFKKILREVAGSWAPRKESVNAYLKRVRTPLEKRSDYLSSI